MDSGLQKRLLQKRLRDLEEDIEEISHTIDHLLIRISLRNPYENLKVMNRTLVYERKRLAYTEELLLKEKKKSNNLLK